MIKNNIRSFDDYIYNVKLQIGKQKVQQNKRKELSTIFNMLNRHEYKRMLIFDYDMYVSDCQQNNQFSDKIFEQHIQQTANWLAI